MLIVAVFVAIVLLFMAIFLFDLQNMVRLRQRTQHGVDAAVLTAAAWQGRSLNTIGELNLLKASLKLITDVQPTNDTSLQGLLDSVELLSNMQTRISYAGPLIGMTTAQQAAKNNGMRSTESFDAHLQAHIDNYIATGAVYESLYGSFQDYDWLPAYRTMIEQIAGNGIACQLVNNRYLSGLPELTGEGADFLMDIGFYESVHANNYCWFYRRGIDYYDSFDFTTIQLIHDSSDYFPGSEYLNLFVTYAQAEPHAEATAILNARNLTPLSPSQEGYDQITWAIYEDHADGQGWDDTSAYPFVNNYLRADFDQSYVYSGAAARAVSFSKPSLIMGRPSWHYGEAEADTSTDYLGDELDWSNEDLDGQNFDDHASRLANAEGRMRSLSDRELVQSSAAAKAFGRLDAQTPPQDVGVVLPVFEAVRLIPAVLVKENIQDRRPDFLLFLLEYFGDPNYPNVPPDVYARHAYFIGAIEQFGDYSSSFRVGWLNFDNWRDGVIAGPDGIPGTIDDGSDPCQTTSGGGGGGGGGGSTPGPPILH